jgi:hypothetical protein
MPLFSSYTGVAARLVDENTSMRVQQRAHIVDRAMRLSVMPVVITVDESISVLAPLSIFVVSLYSTGILQTKSPQK